MSALDFPYEGTFEELESIDAELDELETERRELRNKEVILRGHRSYVVSLLTRASQS